MVTTAASSAPISPSRHSTSSSSSWRSVTTRSALHATRPLSAPKPTLPHITVAVQRPVYSTASDTNMNATTTVSMNVATTTGLPKVSRKRKFIVDAHAQQKRHRTWTELEYEEMLEEATLLCEELELLIAVAADLCRDLALDASRTRTCAYLVRQIQERMAASSDITELQVREMCKQMIAMMRYLCQCHYAHFAMIDMQDQVLACRDRFMRFIVKYAAMVGLS